MTKRLQIAAIAAHLVNTLFVAVFLAAFAFCAPAVFAGPADSTPCSAGSPTRELDFWLGDWNITYPGAPGGSVSKVSLSLDRCEIVESWEDGQGHKGENRFAYNYENQSWRGMFADNRGHVHVFSAGKAAAGSAEFFGPSTTPMGETVLHRIKVSRVNGNKIEQTWEKSADNGASWSTVFKGEYSRKNP
jgi:hypothetical protein